jgi:hypothetical protein
MCGNSALEILRMWDVRLLTLPAPAEKRVPCFAATVDVAQKVGDVGIAHLFPHNEGTATRVPLIIRCALM